jgi:hypothetical protein
MLLSRDCNLKDGMDYTFTRCRIGNIKLSFSGFILLDDCTFYNGNVDISNIDPNSEDADCLTIRMQRCKSEPGLNGIKIESPMIDSIGNVIEANRFINLTAERFVSDTWVDNIDVIRNKFSSSGRIELNFMDAVLSCTTFDARHLYVSEYIRYLIEYSSFRGEIIPIRRNTPLVNEAIMVDSYINKENIVNDIIKEQVLGIPFQIGEGIKQI